MCRFDDNSVYVMPGGLEINAPTVLESDPWVALDPVHHFTLPADDSDLTGTAKAIYDALMDDSEALILN